MGRIHEFFAECLQGPRRLCDLASLQTFCGKFSNALQNFCSSCWNEWLQLPAFNHSWARRHSSIDRVHTSDSGAMRAPLHFAWVAELDQKGLTLQQLFDSWTF